MLELFDRILSHVPVGSVIAGGAVRDYVLDIPHNDIDVFVPYHHVPEGMHLQDRILDPRWRHTYNAANGFLFDYVYAENQQRGQFEYDQMEIGTLLSVNMYTYQEQHRVNIIELAEERGVQQHLDSFDLAICQAAYAGGGIQLSNAFINDWKTKTITAINPNARTSERALRLLNRLDVNWTIREINEQQQ